MVARLASPARNGSERVGVSLPFAPTIWWGARSNLALPRKLYVCVPFRWAT